MEKITKHTMIPLSFAIIAIGGGAAWLTKIDWQSSANAAQIRELNDTQRDHLNRINDTLQSIDEKIGIIEGELKRLVN